MRALLLSTLSLAFVASLVACPPGGDDSTATEGEGEVEIIDGGVDGEGEAEGEGEGEAAAGEGEGEPAGGGEGEGEIQGEPYTGTAEDGVVCGDVTCAAPTASCCFSFFGEAPTCAAPGECGGFAAGRAEAACDGGEDCTAAGSNECCFANAATACVANDTCRTQNGKEICVTDADCNADETCCTEGRLAQVGGDGGVCLPEADNCAGQFGAP